MKITALVLLSILSAVPLAEAGESREAEGKRTITKVVKLLQEMLDKSKEDGEADRVVFAKHKCYCDTNTEEKTKSVEELTTKIGVLENSIQELQGSTGKLSSEVAELSADIAKNEQARKQAEQMRADELEAFTKEEYDLTGAIKQLAAAVDELTAIGADQSLQAADDHKKFMAGHDGSYLKLRSSVKQALLAASQFSPKLGQPGKLKAFLQAPFTGSYSANSGEVVGILQNMKDTFVSNLESARAAEQAAAEAHGKFMETKLSEHDTMTNSYNEKQATLGSNDDALSTKKSQLATSIETKEDDEAFLEKLGVMCSEKAEEYETRKMWRMNEEAAIANAIGILNSAKAHHAFGKVNTTSQGNASTLLQLRAVRSHGANKGQQASLRRLAKLLQTAAHAQGSTRLARVAALVDGKNPFVKVLVEIQKMKAVIAGEAKRDKSQLDWCTSERSANNDNLKAKEDMITAIGDDIASLGDAIDHPQTGLKTEIADTEESITENTKSQRDETSSRREENAVYQQDAKEAREAQKLISEAIGMLQTYYKKLKTALAQRKSKAKVMADPSPPATWQGNYSGQSEKSSSVISMLEFILSETKKEEMTEHETEAEAQRSYEDRMAELKLSEKDLEASLVQSRQLLAEKEAELESKHAELAQTQREHITIARYLEKIKPGCDFITGNFQLRKSRRGEELSALEEAEKLLKETPGFQSASLEDKHKAFGKCKELCISDEASAECQACLGGVSVPGYCAGHPGTPGC